MSHVQAARKGKLLFEQQQLQTSIQSTISLIQSFAKPLKQGAKLQSLKQTHSLSFSNSHTHSHGHLFAAFLILLAWPLNVGVTLHIAAINRGAGPGVRANFRDTFCWRANCFTPAIHTIRQARHKCCLWLALSCMCAGIVDSGNQFGCIYSNCKRPLQANSRKWTALAPRVASAEAHWLTPTAGRGEVN